MAPQHERAVGAFAALLTPQRLGSEVVMNTTTQPALIFDKDGRKIKSSLQHSPDIYRTLQYCSLQATRNNLTTITLLSLSDF